MSNRTSYQRGTVRRKRLGSDVWDFRFMEDGVRKSKRLGTVDKLTTKAAARKEADELVAEINERIAGIRVAGLCDRYLAEKLPKRGSTSSTYRSFGRTALSMSTIT
jgi:hypothetical protein